MPAPQAVAYRVYRFAAGTWVLVKEVPGPRATVTLRVPLTRYMIAAVFTWGEWRQQQFGVWTDR